MEQNHRDRLRDNWVFILNNLLVDKILPILFQRRILSNDLIEQINADSASKQRNYNFLTLIQKRGGSAFQAFIDALIETDQSEISEKLQPGYSACANSFCSGKGEVIAQPEDAATVPTSSLEEDFRAQLVVGGRSSFSGELEEEEQNNEGSQSSLTRTIQSAQPLPLLDRRGSVERSIRQFPTAFDIPITKTTSLSLELSHRLGMGDIYPNFSRPKGLCLIVNNCDFSSASADLSHRKGSDRDAVNLSWLFQEFGYLVEMRRDLDSDSLEETLESFSHDHRHATCDSAIVCILSHGQEKGFYATDGIVISFSAILDIFDGGRCPNLVNKPKIFFFQACRGVRVQRGFDATDSTAAQASGSSSPEEQSSSSSSSSLATADDFYRIDAFGEITVPQSSDDVDDPEMKTSLAKYSDMLVSYSTIPGHISIRHEEMGSWYVQAIVDVFSEFAHSRDINSLLTKVNRKVSKMTTGGHLRKQMPEPKNHLTRDFYFFPAYFKDNQENAINTLFEIGSNQPLPIA